MAPLNPVPVTADHYTVLGLPQTPSTLRKSDLKLAYHRALLKHHPDKSGSGSSTPSNNPKSSEQVNRKFTVDEITSAYKTLSDPVARAEYDRSLRLSGRAAGQKGLFGEEDNVDSFRTGLEVFDLDEMEVEMLADNADKDGEEQSIWYRGCRCGDEKGFLVREEDLEREVERGEVMVGCRGCSLWAKVLFAVEEGDGQDDGNS